MSQGLKIKFHGEKQFHRESYFPKTSCTKMRDDVRLYSSSYEKEIKALLTENHRVVSWPQKHWHQHQEGDISIPCEPSMSHSK